LEKTEDSVFLSGLKKPVFTTDSFTVSPIFFNGGDIGKLAVAGVCNDIAVMGAKPKFLSLSFIIEEGFSIEEFKKILKSIKKETEINEALVVTGDTKVVPKGSCDKLYINISGIGEIEKSFSCQNIEVGDLVLISGDIARHGTVIFAGREGIEMHTKIKSDCSSLWVVIKELIKKDIAIKACRDATRGGVASVLNEWALEREISFEIEEERISICDEVLGICEILGLEPFALANEGTFLAVVSPEDSEKSLEILRKYNKNAAVIGIVKDSYKGRVILKNRWGSHRFLEMPTGEILPRIC